MFDREYDKLNEQQKLAVDTTEGPVLVIAGPGTGKTQLLGLRVANILGQDNGALAENVLCLTFTEAGAANMRERLLRFIGSEAYKVTISTYHGFGQSIIGENPEYFAAQNLQKPIDELGTYQVLAEILENLPMGDINKNYFRDRLGVYAGVTHDLKKSLITPDDLREIAKKNLQDNDTFDSLAADLPAKMPSKVVAAVGIFDDFLSKLQLHPESTKEGRLLCLATKELSSALDGITKTTPLTDWKNKWLVRNNRDKGVLRNSILNKRLTSLAQIYAEYNRILRERGLYDFADMILQTIRALQENDDLRFSLQERYQYILLDEYQDTNPMQSEIVRLLTNNPVNEGRPNVLAVGDDDQAIYAFQGAEADNLKKFATDYLDTREITLQTNYRSGEAILELAGKLAEQITDRFDGKPEKLTAWRADTAQIERRIFTASISEYFWVADKIDELLKNGTRPSEIAVLAPKHALLKDFVPFLAEKDIPIEYQKRENILQTESIQKIHHLTKLLVALQKDLPSNHLWRTVLAFPEWEIASSELWNLALICGRERQKWLDYILENKDDLPAAIYSATMQILDWVNAISVKTTKQILGEIITKLFKFDNLDDPKLYAALSHLTTLWHKVVENKGAEFSLGDFVRYIDDCNKAELQILDANPYKNASDRVQVMSAHAAKGLEWEHVFILDASKQAWNNARTNNSDWPLPDNLRSIKNANADENGRKRLFYVAVTRAKTHLYISSSEQDFDGKRRERLDFLEDCVSCEPILMPEKAEDLTKKVQKGLELSWMRPEVTENLKDLLREKIADFHLSASALNTFLDIEHAGPTEFLMQNILHMPSAQSAEVMLGNAIHAAIDFWQKNKVSPDELRKFLAKYLETRTDIAPDKLVEFTDYGAGILENYLAAKALMFGLPSDSEVSLGYGGQEIRVGEARLVGKIDRLEFDENAKTITIVDFKTGKYPTSKSSAISRHKYTEQLYFYKILLELSGKYRNYQIIGGRLEYIKPDEETGGLPEPIEVVFEASIENRLRRLIGAVWKMISEVEFWSADEISARGLHKMAEFEEFLLEK